MRLFSRTDTAYLTYLQCTRLHCKYIFVYSLNYIANIYLHVLHIFAIWSSERKKKVRKGNESENQFRDCPTCLSKESKETND